MIDERINAVHQWQDGQIMDHAVPAVAVAHATATTARAAGRG
jgi:hypothetical protein